jgi:hypothetical protein
MGAGRRRPPPATPALLCTDAAAPLADHLRDRIRAFGELRLGGMKTGALAPTSAATACAHSPRPVMTTMPSNASIQVPMLYAGQRLLNGNSSALPLRRFASKLGPDWMAGIAVCDNVTSNFTWVSTSAPDFKPGEGYVIPKMGAAYDALKNGRSWCGTVTHNMSSSMMSGGGNNNRFMQMNNMSGGGGEQNNQSMPQGGGQQGGGQAGQGGMMNNMKPVPFSACFRPLFSNGSVVGTPRCAPSCAPSNASVSADAHCFPMFKEWWDWASCLPTTP